RRQELDAAGAKQVARSVLSILTGVAGEVELAAPPPQEPPHGDLEAALAGARARADLAAAAAAISAAEADVDATRARLYPTLQGTASYTHQEPRQAFQPQDAWRVLVSLTLPLFQTGGEYYDIRDRESTAALLRLDETTLRKRVHDEVT